MKQVGRPKKQNKNTQLKIDVEKLKSIFERHSQILKKILEKVQLYCF